MAKNKFVSKGRFSRRYESMTIFHSRLKIRSDIVSGSGICGTLT